jgi:ATP-dependent Clp protease ATP-binding subunit ClpC
LDERIRSLIEAVLGGEEGAEAALLEHLDAMEVVPAEVLLELAGAESPRLRLAAVRAASGVNDDTVLAAIDRLAADPDADVRLALVERIRETPEWRVSSALTKLLRDASDEIRLGAVRAAESRIDVTGPLLERLAVDDNWQVRRAAALGLSAAPPDEALPALVESLGNDDTREVGLAAATAAEALMVEAGGWPPGASLPAVSALRGAWNHLTQIGAGDFPTLSPWLEDLVAHELDLAALSGFGTDLTALAEEGRLPRAHEAEETLDALTRILESEGSRTAVLLGESGTGKTAIVHELVHRLRDPASGRPWRVLRVSPSDFLVGTTFLGEWETKLNRLVNEIRWPRRLLLYVPAVHELASVGRSSVSDANVATALAPHLESGAVTILGESTPEEFAMGLGRIGSLRRLFQTVEVAPADEAVTRRIVTSVAEEAGADWSPAELDRFLELADYYFVATAQPGRAVGLLRVILETQPEIRASFSERRVLESISVSTGIPVGLLDDRAPLDLSEVRSFFESRVMGQAEAVDAVLDLVTLIKAGLTDPTKPFGVLFFVGPTGVGKTELARAVAEFVFGDPSRLVRMDMSEFATYDAFERLIGKGYGSGLLTSVAREKPLSVILLDEIEKAHGNVFDLCLQIFDAGRLTDGQGRVADFRRSVLILTSNVGSVVPLEESFGFVREERAPPERETTLREVYRFFRPEFLNRLDRIVVFKPLSPQTAEKIARRELARVVERSGITRRALSVDVDSSVISLLLRRGYSPAFGARPLKRTIEQTVLLPVARTISSGRAPAGSVLRLVAKGEHVEVAVAPPEGKASRSRSARRERAGIEARLTELRARAESLAERAGPLAARKSELLLETGEPDFWKDRGSALAKMDEIHRLEGVMGAVEKLSRRVGGFRPGEEGKREEEILERLEQESARVEFLLSCGNARDLGDAIVALSLVRSSGPGLDAVGRLAGMYASFARRRRLEVEVIDDRQGGEPFEDSIVLLVSGVGSFGLLAGEEGLHHVTRTVGAKDRPKRERDVVRVEVFPEPRESDPPPDRELRAETSPVRGVPGRLDARPRTEISLLHLPTMTSVKAWTPAGPADAPARVLPLLLVRCAAAGGDPHDAPKDPVIRRYSLGPTPRVTDLRSGRTTGSLDRVLAGDLELFLQAEPA